METTVVSIEAVSALFKLKRTRGNDLTFRVCCPLCGDEAFSCGCNNAMNSYHCFKCEEHGSALDLYSRMRLGKPVKGNYKEAIRAYESETESNEKTAVRKEKVKKPELIVVKRAESAVCDKTFRALLSLPVFALSDRHRGNLTNRGLSEDSIDRNGYGSFLLRTMEESFISPKALEIVRWARGDEYFTAFLKSFGLRRTAAGVEVGLRLEKMGCTMKGVPGFFKICGQWAFKAEDGMYIPTRNVSGQIIAMQIRTDIGSLRYKTVSASSLPEGVNKDVSGIHFPLGNAKLSEVTKVYLTEGPLKSDVCSDLTRPEKTFFVALQGVTNTSQLAPILKEIREAGVTTICNALDMDRLTNYNVMKAGRKLRNLAEQEGLNFKNLFWDEETAKNRAEEFQKICEDQGIPVPESANPFVRLGLLTKALADDGYKLTEEEKQWESETKGLDDFLKKQKKSRTA